jgi:transposase
MKDIMWINYAAGITQSEDELLRLERRLRHRPTADRVQLLRLLKTRAVRSLRAAAPLLGYSERQVQRWWALYKTGGLEALCAPPSRQGSRARLSAEALAALHVAMAAGQIARLHEAQAFLRERCGILYHSLNGVSQLFKRQKIKLKTGRRRHRQSNPTVQAAFKK